MIKKTQNITLELSTDLNSGKEDDIWIGGLWPWLWPWPIPFRKSILRPKRPVSFATEIYLNHEWMHENALTHWHKWAVINKHKYGFPGILTCQWQWNYYVKIDWNIWLNNDTESRFLRSIIRSNITYMYTARRWERKNTEQSLSSPNTQ